MVCEKAQVKQGKSTTRERVLDAAERLLAQGSAAFSMRVLAADAGLSFATPFNQFGSKAAIMQALSAQRIALMRERFTQTKLPRPVTERTLMATDIAVSVMLAEPDVNRIVMAAIGGPSEEPGNVMQDSSALWAEALRDGEGLAVALGAPGLDRLPVQLAIAFRGVLSFWTAGEIPDQKLSAYARAAVATVLLGFVSSEERSELLKLLT